MGERTIKRILITGANKGIGFAAARALLQQHPDVTVLLGARDTARGRAAIQALSDLDPGYSSRLALVQIDVADPLSVTGARDAVAQLSGPDDAPLYGIVNNAGIGLASDDTRGVLEVNLLGVKRVCDAFLPLLQSGGRIVNVSSASGPKFVSECAPQRQAFFTDPTISWEELQQLVDDVLDHAGDAGYFRSLGLGEPNAYGLSKACVSLYTMQLARQHPHLCINACTPGYIETDLTRPQAERQGVDPADMGMKAPEFGTVSILFLLFGDTRGSGHYFGSDAKRSPLDRYRAPGSPEYAGA